jgi:type IV pilus assembly protein PilC
MLLISGLPLERCLSALVTGASGDKAGLLAIRQLREKISSGMSLSEGMVCLGIFSEMEVKTVRAAEEVGCPGVALGKLAEFGKKISAIGKKVKSSLVYPAIVLTVAGFSLLLLMVVVVPKFETIFESQRSDGKQLPRLTLNVMNFCKFFGHHFSAILITTIVFAVAVKICLGKRVFRNRMLAFCSHLPFFGELITTINLNNFFRTIGMLMSFGVPLQDAMRLSVDVISAGRLRLSLERTLKKIIHGEAVDESFTANKLLSPTDHGLIFAGEQSGNLAQSFEKIAEIYGDKIEAQLALLTTLIEPVIILFLAAIVGTVVMAIFLPMANLMQNLHP